MPNWISKVPAYVWLGGWPAVIAYAVAHHLISH